MSTRPLGACGHRRCAHFHQCQLLRMVLDLEMDGAMHSIWLHGDWRWITRSMTTQQREYAADAVQRYSFWLNEDSAGLDPLGTDELRWWRYQVMSGTEEQAGDARG